MSADRDWEVVVTCRGKEVEVLRGRTRRGARMEASGMNITFARGARCTVPGGLFRAPQYEPVPYYASARVMAQEEPNQ